MPYTYWGLQTDDDDDDDHLFDLPLPASSFPLPSPLRLPPLTLGWTSSMSPGTTRKVITLFWFSRHTTASRHWQLAPPNALPSSSKPGLPLRMRWDWQTLLQHIWQTCASEDTPTEWVVGIPAIMCLGTLLALLNQFCALSPNGL